MAAALSIGPPWRMPGCGIEPAGPSGAASRSHTSVSFPVKRTIRKETGRPLNASAET